MDEVNQMITDCKNKRLQKTEELMQDVEKLKLEPEAKFNDAYKHSFDELSAKDGLGKTFGQPRRFV